MRLQRLITVVGCHAEGEVGRVITGGVLPPPGATVFEQKRYLETAGRRPAAVSPVRTAGWRVCPCQFNRAADPIGQRREALLSWSRLITHPCPAPMPCAW